VRSNQKGRPGPQWFQDPPASDGLFEKARTDAPGTGLHPLDLTRLAVDAPDLLKVGVPCLRALVVGMTDLVTLHRLLAAYLADSRHIQTPL
jgi:hypothetical protein